MKYAFQALLGAGLLLSADTAFAETWRPYQDNTRQCGLQYPSTIFERDSLDDNDFQNFYDSDGSAFFRIKSLPNEQNLTPGEIKAEFVEKSVAILIFDEERENFLLLSGMKGGDIFYTKIAFSEDRKTLCVLHVQYPTVEKALDHVVVQMAASLRVRGSRVSSLEQ